ncbi:MAG TPA: YlxR family protein [Clostridia bacterium]|nr:YlxR family protein [Clostridia bacterium]
MRPKHVPVRTCIGCQMRRPKREMIRIVRTPKGEVMVDPTGKRSGRGTYICPVLECLETAFKKNRLGGALDCSIGEEDMKRLRTELEERIHELTIKGPTGGRG